MRCFQPFLFFLYLLTIHGFILPNFDFKANRLASIRNNIDQVDDRIYQLITERLRLASELKTLKESVHDPLREISILSRLKEKKELDPKLVRKIWILLFHESYKVQEDDDTTTKTG
ncbi:MAG: chorismate mutase [Bacteroidota bacterium]|nr:chorismate mutase [Bacteroidota bacterium]